jgi:hypothetical protein
VCGHAEKSGTQSGPTQLDDDNVNNSSGRGGSDDVDNGSSSDGGTPTGTISIISTLIGRWRGVAYLRTASLPRRRPNNKFAAQFNLAADDDVAAKGRPSDLISGAIRE